MDVSMLQGVGRQGSMNGSFLDDSIGLEAYTAQDAFFVPEDLDEGLAPLTAGAGAAFGNSNGMSALLPGHAAHVRGGSSGGSVRGRLPPPAAGALSPGLGPYSGAGWMLGGSGAGMSGARSTAAHSPLVSARTVAALMAGEEEELMQLDGPLQDSIGCDLWGAPAVDRQLDGGPTAEAGRSLGTRSEQQHQQHPGQPWPHAMQVQVQGLPIPGRDGLAALGGSYSAALPPLEHASSHNQHRQQQAHLLLLQQQQLHQQQQQLQLHQQQHQLHQQRPKQHVQHQTQLDFMLAGRRQVAAGTGAVVGIAGATAGLSTQHHAAACMAGRKLTTALPGTGTLAGTGPAGAHLPPPLLAPPGPYQQHTNKPAGMTCGTPVSIRSSGSSGDLSRWSSMDTTSTALPGVGVGAAGAAGTITAHAGASPIPMAGITSSAGTSSDSMAHQPLDAQASVKQPVPTAPDAAAAAAAATVAAAAAVAAAFTASNSSKRVGAGGAASKLERSSAKAAKAAAGAAKPAAIDGGAALLPPAATKAAPAAAAAAAAVEGAGSGGGSGGGSRTNSSAQADSSHDSTHTLQQQQDAASKEAAPAVAAAGGTDAGAAAAAAGAVVQGSQQQQQQQPRQFHHRGGGPCDHCGVMESPQWRRGPSSKPILCNACGTRWRRSNSLGPPIPSAGRPGGSSRGGSAPRNNGASTSSQSRAKRAAEELGPPPLPVNYDGGVHTGTRQARNPHKRPPEKQAKST